MKHGTPRPPDDDRRRYRRISVRINNDEKYRALSSPQPNAKSLFLHCIFGPETTIVPGLVLGGEMTLAESLGWSLQAFRRCWRELEAAGMAKADWSNRLVWLPNGIVHNPPESPNVCIAWFKALRDEIPPSPLREEAKARMEGFMVERGFDEAFLEAFRSGSGMASRKPSVNPSGLQKQEQEQEQEQKYLEGVEPMNGSSLPPPTTILEFPTIGDPPVWLLTEYDVAHWRMLFPGIDVLAECRKALAWTEANKRKTARGMKRFLVRWLSTASDRAPARPAVPTPSNGPDPIKARYGNLKFGR